MSLAAGQNKHRTTGDTMETIRDHKLYQELKASPSWGTLFHNDALKNDSIPAFAGCLDHIHVTRTSVQFHDAGCNGRDHSFRIMDQPLYVVCYSDNPFFGTPWHLYAEAKMDGKPEHAFTESEFLEFSKNYTYRFVSAIAYYYGHRDGQSINEIISEMRKEN
jgi:hypothetical protein